MSVYINPAASSLMSSGAGVSSMNAGNISGFGGATLGGGGIGDSVANSFASASNWNAWGSAIGIGATVVGGLFSMYYSNKAAKAQARLAKAQARIQANEYAAQAVSYEYTAQRIAQAYGAQEYESVRQQNAYLESMVVDAAVRGGAMEGTNAYMIDAQEKEFARENAYNRTASEREQANYILAAAQSMQNAKNVLAAGRVEAASIRSQNRANLASGFMNMISGTLNIANNYITRRDELAMRQASYQRSLAMSNELYRMRMNNYNLAWAYGGF